MYGGILTMEIKLNLDMVKVIKNNVSTSACAPYETRTKDRIYAYVGHDNRMRSINFYDDYKRSARIMIYGNKRYLDDRVYKVPYIEYGDGSCDYIDNLDIPMMNFLAELNEEFSFNCNCNDKIDYMKHRFIFKSFEDWIENNLCTLDVSSFIYKDKLYTLSFVSYDIEMKLRKHEGKPERASSNIVYDYNMEQYYYLCENGKLIYTASLNDILNEPWLDGLSIKDRYNELITLDV